MTTPLYTFLKEYAASGIARLHMPGHKGNHPYEVLREMSRWDITEVSGADSLFEADGVLFQSEENTSALYGSAHTCFSAGGSTLCIQAMIALTCKPGDTIIAARNAHKAFINACTLLDVTPHWICPQYNDSFGVSGEVTDASVEEAIAACPQAKAVYVTSPDYLGCISDIAAIAGLCRAHGIPLLVDNAHGAHLKFLPRDCHPLTLGASLCCDSAHKTLPVFTGGAYLHTAKGAPYTREQVKSAMALFGSTSPSYLILLSLDLNNRYLAEQGRADFASLEQTVKGLCVAAQEKGFPPISAHFDPTKLTFDACRAGMTGEELADHFRAHGVECEYAARRHVVLMLSPQNTAEEIARVREAIAAISPSPSVSVPEDEPFSIPKTALRVREAAFAASEWISVDEACGRISAETKIKCPPGVPIVIAGERIDEHVQKLLKRSSIFGMNVVK